MSRVTRAFKRLCWNQNKKHWQSAWYVSKSMCQHWVRSMLTCSIYNAYVHSATHMQYYMRVNKKKTMRQIVNLCICFIVLKFRYIFCCCCFLFSFLIHVADSSRSAWSLRNFSTIFLTYLSCRESGFPFISSALYGGFIITSLNTTMLGPRHVTCKNTNRKSHFRS